MDAGTDSIAARRRPTRWTAALYQARTEGGTPLGQALAVGLGLYIGASPFYGFHLLLALLFGRLFRVNRLKVYLASNISNPLIAPFLCAGEIQVGAWLRRGEFYSAASLPQMQLQGLALDILLGSVVVGVVLALLGMALTYAVVSGRAHAPPVAGLVADAAARYLPAGLGAWELSHGKLRSDPVYLQVLRDGILPNEGTLVDLGCGRGLMLALLAAARERVREHAWPAEWAPPPMALRLVGMERRARAARRAREALDQDATIETVDVAIANVPPCQAVLLFDVLHLMPREAQERLLHKAAAALSGGGVLVLREANAAGGWRFSLVRFGNRITALFQAESRRRFHFRTMSEWIDRLRALGFVVEPAPGYPRTALGNFLLYARMGPYQATGR